MLFTWNRLLFRTFQVPGWEQNDKMFEKNDQFSHFSLNFRLILPLDFYTVLVGP